MEMIQMLEKQILKKVDNKKGRTRPDEIIAQQIKDMRTIYLTIEKTTIKNKIYNGEDLWNNWFSKFSSKYWRKRNLRAALSNVNLEMKKNA